MVLLIGGLALGQDTTPGVAADGVLAADDAGLRKLAARARPDPWLVTDLLCVRGRFKKAEAFARAAAGPDTAKLPGYVAALRKAGKPDPKTREIARQARRAKRAERTGWLVRASFALALAHGSAFRIGKPDRARRIAKRRLADAALAHATRAVAIADEVDARWELLGAQTALAEIQESRKQHADAAATARRAVLLLPRVVQGLAEDQGARAREEWLRLLQVGTRAAWNLRDAPAACFFLESGRAGTLLESLGARTHLRGDLVPKPLREKEAQARADERHAKQEFDRARATRKRKQIKQARARLAEARKETAEVVASIQRNAKRAAGLIYPEALPLPRIQRLLREGDALLLYTLAGVQAGALVITPTDARLVTLKKEHLIERAVQALRADPNKSKELRRLLLDPLKLDPETKRLLISPVASLAYVPFVLLAPAREVVYLPSATTYALLAADKEKRGQRVLALGDPSYPPGKLPALPGTRIEAQAVGDLVLLGKDATETRVLQTARKSKRWRAVHFACHGLIDPERPLLCSLALTPDQTNDGRLTVLEIFRNPIPCDLAVLSACDTARGRIYRAEGVIGLTRAFMFAGAPRVLCSLWKVDDQATRALMVEFYRLWNPKDGTNGLPAATALKQAQEFVAGHPKWKHPRFWAAWQLWGLGN